MTSRSSLFVIATVALLSAVLLPTFSRRFRKAGESSAPLLAEKIPDDPIKAGDTSSFLESDLEVSEEVQKALALREKLTNDPDDQKAREEYMSLLGDIEWGSPEEEAAFTGSRSDNVDSAASLAEEAQDPGDHHHHHSHHRHAPIPEMGPLASTDASGTLYFREAALLGSKESNHQFARLFTGRRDYTVETRVHTNTDGSKYTTPKYVIDGETWSLHQRMYLYRVGDPEPKYVIRRAYNYLNPIARILGQYTYRIVPYKAEQGRWASYSPADAIFTVTQDRIGRGALWLREEWRVYKGDGGCRKSYGVFGCEKRDQIFYGVTETSKWSTSFYDAVTERNPTSPENMVARLEKASGQPRALAWPFMLVKELHKYLPFISATTFLWADKYELKFHQPVDEMLFGALVAMQDVTRDVRRGHKR